MLSVTSVLSYGFAVSRHAVLVVFMFVQLVRVEGVVAQNAGNKCPEMSHDIARSQERFYSLSGIGAVLASSNQGPRGEWFAGSVQLQQNAVNNVKIGAERKLSVMIDNSFYRDDDLYKSDKFTLVIVMFARSEPMPVSVRVPQITVALSRNRSTWRLLEYDSMVTRAVQGMSGLRPAGFLNGAPEESYETFMSLHGGRDVAWGNIRRIDMGLDPGLALSHRFHASIADILNESSSTYEGNSWESRAKIYEGHIKLAEFCRGFANSKCYIHTKLVRLVLNTSPCSGKGSQILEEAFNPGDKGMLAVYTPQFGEAGIKYYKVAPVSN